MRPSASILAKLADFQEWSKTGAEKGPISLLDYVGFVATPDLLFGFAELFCPDLIVHQGWHFLGSGFSADVYEQWLRAGKSPREIQRVMNHVHVSTLLQQQVISDDVAVEVARIIAEIWSRTLGPEGLVAEVVGSNFDDAAATFFEGPQRGAEMRCGQGA